MKSASFINLVISIIFMAILILSGVKINKMLNERANQQVVVNDSIDKWKQDMSSLRAYAKRWNTIFSVVSTIHDVDNVLAVVDAGKYGLLLNAEKVLVTNIDKMTMADIPIGITKVCLASTDTGGGVSVVFRAKDYQQLLNGVDKLLQRKDILASNVILRGGKEFPEMAIGGFCLLLRVNEWQQ